MVKVEILNKDTFVPQRDKHVVLNTCNRTEIYSGEGEIPEEVIKHLFRVTTGLESSLIGEKAIQGQVKEAYKTASETGLSSSIHKLFQRALNVGKNVRTNTGINRGAVSHSQATVDLLINLNLNLKNSHITLIGAHNLNEKIIYYLLKKGAETVFLGNRTYYKAKEISEKYNSAAFHLDTLKEVLQKTDILITATAAPHAIIHKDNFPMDKEMTIIDLAVPSDTDIDVQNLDNVHYVDNTGVEKTVNVNLGIRELEFKKASIIVENEVELFLEKLKNDTERTYEKVKSTVSKE
ncbi:MAG: hypothetical protein OCD02_17840 [Spirochaetaceae bacterium]